MKQCRPRTRRIYGWRSIGLAMISVSERAWKHASDAKMPRFYFDLAKARKSLESGETPWTPAVGVLFAMDVALEMLEAEGYPQIFDRHERCAAAGSPRAKRSISKAEADRPRPGAPNFQTRGRVSGRAGTSARPSAPGGSDRA